MGTPLRKQSSERSVPTSERRAVKRAPQWCGVPAVYRRVAGDSFMPQPGRTCMSTPSPMTSLMPPRSAAFPLRTPLQDRSTSRSIALTERHGWWNGGQPCYNRAMKKTRGAVGPKKRKGPDESAGPRMKEKMGDIGKMFIPKRLPFSALPTKRKRWGRLVLTNLLRSGEHKTFPVNLNRKTVLGVTCYPTIGSHGEKIDLAVVATPARMVPDIIEDCGKTGVEGIVIVTDFIELGEEGRKLEEEIKKIRKAFGTRILGPNSIGIIRPQIGLNASILEAQPERGNIAFISQSASIGRVMADRAIAANVGFSIFVSLGSMIDIDFGQLIDFLGEDPGTRSIMMYMETMGHARRFMSAARGFSSNKPIVVVKSGQLKRALRHLCRTPAPWRETMPRMTSPSSGLGWSGCAIFPPLRRG